MPQRRSLVLRCILPLLALLAVACTEPATPEKGPRKVVVEPPQPLVGPGAAESFPGTLRARNEADLSFRVPGKIAERRVELGSRVKAGDVIAVLDPEDARLNLQAARAAVAAARADLALAENEERRYRDLKARGHVGQSAVDQRVATLDLARARLKQAESQLDLAQNQSSYTQLRADADGVITQVLAEPGNVVSAGQPVVHFAANGEREVEIAVPEGRADALRQAAQLMIQIYSRPDEHYPGQLRDITPQADRVTRTHEARVTLLDGPADLALGASATVLFATPADGKTFRLPAAALGSVADDQAVVWKLADPQQETTEAQPVPVQVLQYLEDSVVISADLAEEDRLITAGVHLLRPGLAVQAIDRSAKAAL